jgi:hypothetical protein
MKKSMCVLTITVLLTTFTLSGCGTFDNPIMKPRPWTRGEILAAGISTGASLYNMYESERMLDRLNTHEMFPHLGEHPSDTRLIGTMLTTQLATLAVAHYFPVVRLPIFGDCEIRVPLLLGKAGFNFGLAMRDSEVGK